MKKKTWISVMRLNNLLAKKEITKSVRLGRFSAEFEWRSKSNLWGRFGGGWDWHIGAQWSRRSMVIFCLVFMLRFNVEERP